MPPLSFEDQISSSEIPFPARRELLEELRREAVHNGTGTLNQDDLDELSEVHSNWLRRVYRHEGRLFRAAIDGMSFLPLTLVLITIFREGKMIEFMQQGGIGMYGVLTLGACLLASEVFRAYRLFLLKDHRESQLRLPTRSFALAIASLICLALSMSLLDFYFVLENLPKFGFGQEAFWMGIKESLTPMVLGLFLSAILLLLRSGTRSVLERWGVPAVAA